MSQNKESPNRINVMEVSAKHHLVGKQKDVIELFIELSR